MNVPPQVLQGVKDSGLANQGSRPHPPYGRCSSPVPDLIFGDERVAEIRPLLETPEASAVIPRFIG